jgi:hypothetical protein
MWGDLTFVGNFCELAFMGGESSFVHLYSSSNNVRVIMSRILGRSGLRTHMWEKRIQGFDGASWRKEFTCEDLGAVGRIIVWLLFWKCPHFLHVCSLIIPVISYYLYLCIPFVLRERDHWEDPDVDGRIILRWIFRKWDGFVGICWTWLRIGTVVGHLWVR